MDAEAERAVANETERMALAPNRPLLGEPSRLISIWSIARWLNGSSPINAGAMMLLTFSTARITPLPIYLD
jgi:hypothetical protein